MLTFKSRLKNYNLRKELKKILKALPYLLPSLIIIGAFRVYPIIYTLYLSLHDWDMIGIDRDFIGLSNYIRLFLRDGTFRHSLGRTAIFTLGSVPIIMILALFFSLLLSQNIRLKKYYRTIYFFPVVISMAIVSLIFSWMFQSDVGLFNYILDFLGQSPIRWLTDYTWAMVSLIIMTAWKAVGYYMILFLAGLNNIEDHYYEAAKIDGANFWQRFWHITFPLLSPTTFFVLIIAIINSFQIFTQVHILTQGGPMESTNVLIFYLYRQAFIYFDMGYASAIAYVLAALVFIFTMFQFKFVGKKVHY